MKKLLHFLWRSQPHWVRRLELRLANTYLGQSLKAQRPLSSGPIIVVGFFGTASGLGQVARQMFNRLRTNQFPVFAANVSSFVGREDFPGDSLWPDTIPQGGLTIFHVNPDLLTLTQRAIGQSKLAGRKIIGCWAWELDVVPKQWVCAMRCVDEIWPPTRFIADAFMKAAPNKPIHVVPYALDLDDTPTIPHHDPLPEHAGKIIVFFMFDVRSTYARKNPEAVIEAYRRAVRTDDNSVLIVKVSGAESWPEALTRLRVAAQDRTDIHILQKKFSEDGMRDLLARVDIVMSLHRSEGFGLLMVESMAAAKPVIATGWSGNVDFMNKQCSILIDVTLVPVVDPQNTYNHYGALWAEPDIGQAALALRHLLDNPAERQRLGKAARTHVLDYFSRQNFLRSLPTSFWDSLPKDKEIEQKRLLS